MARPNIVTCGNLFANCSVLTVTTVNSNVIVNPSTSNTLYKIDSLTVANGNLSSSANVTVSLFRGGSEFAIAANVTVPTSATVVVVTKDSTLHMLEGDALRVYASANVGMQSVISWEEFS